jgi:hypothetical protein
VWAQPFPATGAKWQISSNGGAHPKWQGDGRELFYMSADGKMMAVEVKAGPTFRAGIPRALFETNVPDRFASFAVTRDGQRFLIPTPMVGTTSAPATVVINWTAGIKR